MKATRFFLRRYRAFDRETEIALRGLTVLTGPNNLGKSTVLLGLRLFFSALSAPGFLSTRLYDFDDDYPKRYSGRPGRRVQTRLSVEFSLGAPELDDIQEKSGGFRFPETVIVHVEFLHKRGRASITTQPESPDEVRDLLCQQISDRVRYVYIPANRGTDRGRYGRQYQPTDVQAEISRLAFSKVRNTRRRLEAVERLVADATREVDQLRQELAEELRRYMPDLQSIEFEIAAPDVRDLLRLHDIAVNDGATTPLAQKGDGVKNLFTIAVLQYVARQDPGDHLILGIEEPEAHLHSSAIYKLKPELRALAQQNQVLITTHSPILIERDQIQNNLIVDRATGPDFSSTVRPARNLAEIRTCLGIKPQDNMTTAEVVVVVEGDTEVTVCSKLLARFSGYLAEALESGRIRLLPANGASKISSIVRALARDAASCIALFDNDEEGRRSRDDLAQSGLIGPQDIFLVPDRAGCQETEFEDLFDPALYVQAVNEACGTALTVADMEDARRRSGGRGTRCAKWSTVMEQELGRRGKAWVALKAATRTAFAKAVALRVAELNLADYPSLNDIAARCAAMLREQDEHAGHQPAA